MSASKLLLTGAILGFGLMAAGVVEAKPAATNNQCWGKVASGLAQFDSPYVTDDMNGGGMGMHSRASQGATNNGGFANSDFGFGPGPRDGVGNVSAGAPHNTAPGDGGNGQHAVNNGEFFSTIADPVTGTILTPGSPTGGTIECDLLDQNIVP